MSGILTSLCGQFYNLTKKLHKRDDYFKMVFDNVLKFDQNVHLNELDAILASGNKAIEAYDKTLITFEKVKETEHAIVGILKKIGVRPRWYLTGELPGEMEFIVWYDDKDKLYMEKTRDVTLEPKNPHSFWVRLATPRDQEDDDSYMKPDNDDDYKFEGYDDLMSDVSSHTH